MNKQGFRKRLIVSAWILLAGIVMSSGVAAAEDLPLQEEQAMRAALDRVSDSVVRIQTVGGLARVGKVALGDGPCTGLVVSPDGYIISSSFNFARQPSTILVELPDGTSQPAQLVARDNSRSLALLKVDLPDNAPPLVVPEASPAAAAQPGAWAIAVGRTFDAKQPNVSIGIISAVNRIWGKAVQTDAKISPNNYGGPLVDIQGRVFGVLVPLSPQAQGAVAGAEWYDSGIGFAVPLTHILKVLPQLKEGKDLDGGLMGISMRGRDQFGAPPVVAAAQPASPAAKAGVKAGDKIVEVNGKAVVSLAQLKHQVSPLYAGEAVQLAVVRDKQRLTFDFELTDKLVPYAQPFLGILPRRDGGEGEGIEVRFVYADSPAAEAGVQPGDRIDSIADIKMQSRADAFEALSAVAVGESVAVELQRDGKPIKVDVQLSAMPEDIPESLPAARETVDADDDVEVGAIEIKLPEFKNECLAYIPENYSPEVSYGVVIWLHSPGEFQKEELVDRWQQICDTTDLILLAPKARDAEKWNADEVEFINRALDKLQKDYQIDESRIVVHGKGPGGAMAGVYFHSPESRANGLAVVDSVLPQTVRPRPMSPTIRAAIYWARGAKGKNSERADGQIKQLRDAKYPVTTRDLGASRYLNADELAELARWIDTLDRFQAMQRLALVILAILFLLVGITLTFSDVDNPMWGASAIRIGVFLAALWLAFPHLGRITGSAWIYVVVLGVVIARWRYLLPVAIVILGAIALLRRFAPKPADDSSKSRPTTRK